MKKETIYNIPNIITTIRLLLLPLLFYSILKNYLLLSVIVYIIIAFGDSIDGLCARKFKQESDIGALYDVTVDRIVVITALILVTVTRMYISRMTLFAILFPFTVILISKYLYVKKTKTPSTLLIGKITGIAAYITGFLYIINFNQKEDMLFITIILLYISMCMYVERTLNTILPEK